MKFHPPIVIGSLLALICAATLLPTVPGRAEAQPLEHIEAPSPLLIKEYVDAVATEKEHFSNEYISQIADVIEEVEGRCAGRGKSGERGCFQYLPSTWKTYSLEVSGEVLPHTAENERMVAETMIRTWLEEGISERGVFLTWNQGTPGPDCYRGVNQWGIAYDSCAYADRAEALMEEYTNQKSRL